MSTKNETFDEMNARLEAKWAEEDAQIEASPEDDPQKRTLSTFEGFSGMEVSPREVDGKPYDESLDA